MRGVAPLTRIRGSWYLQGLSDNNRRNLLIGWHARGHVWLVGWSGEKQIQAAELFGHEATWCSGQTLQCVDACREVTTALIPRSSGIGTRRTSAECAEAARVGQGGGRYTAARSAMREQGRNRTGIASLPHVKLSPMSATGPTGEREEHFDAVPQAASQPSFSLRRSRPEETLVSGARHSHNQVGDRSLARGVADSCSTHNWKTRPRNSSMTIRSLTEAQEVTADIPEDSITYEARKSSPELTTRSTRNRNNGGLADLWYMDDGDIMCHPILVPSFLQEFDVANARVRAERNPQNTEVLNYANDLDAAQPEWRIRDVQNMAKVTTDIEGTEPTKNGRSITLGVAAGPRQYIADQLFGQSGCQSSHSRTSPAVSGPADGICSPS